MNPPCPHKVGQGGFILRIRTSIFYSALILTAVNLLLRLTGTAFHVYLSRQIGAAGIGLLQLILSVTALASTAATAGIRTGTMYLTAEEIGKKRPANVFWILSGAILYSILFSISVGAALYYFAPLLAEKWIGNGAAVNAIRLYAAFLPVNCLCGVMTGYFTAAGRVLALALVEIIEQFLSIIVTFLSLLFWANNDPGRACQCVIIGGCTGALFTLCCLILLRLKEHPGKSARISVRKRITDTALPLGLADDLKAGISTTENLMVPKRLGMFPGASNPVAVFGTVCGMVFPLLMLPCAVLFGLTELLVPEMARCNAAGNQQRIRYLMERSLKLVVIYGSLFAGLLFALAEPLCLKLYRSADAGNYLQLYAPLALMLYTDIVTDAMIKGLGQQRASVRYNILTSSMDVVLLFVLLPRYGMTGYFLSFTVTHAINFFLSIRRLVQITNQPPPIRCAVTCIICAIAGVLTAIMVHGALWKTAVFFCVYFSCLSLLRGISREDLHWLKTIVKIK